MLEVRNTPFRHLRKYRLEELDLRRDTGPLLESGCQQEKPEYIMIYELCHLSRASRALPSLKYVFPRVFKSVAIFNATAGSSVL